MHTHTPGSLKSLELNAIKSLPGLSNTTTRETGIPGCQRRKSLTETQLPPHKRGTFLLQTWSTFIITVKHDLLEPYL